MLEEKKGNFINFSGLAIENPDDIEKIVQKAQETGKEVASKPEIKTACTVTLYKNGFNINDGEFRPYTEESTK